MPPKKKPVVPVDPTAINTTAQTTRRLTRSSSSNTTPAKSSTGTTTAATTAANTTATTSKTKPTSTAGTDMGSAVSKAKAIKARKSRKSNGTEVAPTDSTTITTNGYTNDPSSPSSSSKQDQAVEESSSATPNGKGKRKTTTAPEPKAATAKKHKVSKSADDENAIVVPKVVSKPMKPAKKSQPKNVEEWFEFYASEEDPNQIDVPGIIRLLEDLCVKFESAAIYILCWKLGLPTMGSIPREKWIDGMKKFGVANNAQLLKTLGTWLDQTKPVSPASDNFLAFFKYMFQFSKNAPEARTVALDSAIAVLAFVLDPLTYDLKYDPETAVPLGWENHPYPHAVPFVEFLTEKQPVKVINKDQWESFLPFNRSVEYMLGNYDPEGAWPALYDQYVDWRKERDGLTVGPKDGPDTES